MKTVCTILLSLLSFSGFSQIIDTTKTKTMKEVSVTSSRIKNDISRLDSVKGTFIYSGKKNEVINLNNKDAAITEKYGRQIFAKIPGVFVYDMDGTGNQVNISTRGLDPHRGWEFNIRKDGIITNSDMYGYPASHYNIPMEAVERIELVRGTGSLQYGAQFGGMLNYVSKQPDSTKAFSFESINTVGSYGLLSTFNSAGGTLGKFKYNAWFNSKKSDGYRKSNNSESQAQNISLFYQATENLLFKAEWTRSDYIIQLAGPLTDAMFLADPRSATRSRNFYKPVINVPSISMDWQAGKNTRLSFTSSAILGDRNSVLFDKPATIADSINRQTFQFNNRQVDIDNFNSYTSELRILQSYQLFNQSHSLAAGVQYMNNDLHRRQLGVGSTGSDFDLSVTSAGFGRDMHFRTKNVAVFAENRWEISPRLSLNAGIRSETGETNLSGTIKNYPANEIPNTIKHNFPLLGLNAQYSFKNNIDIYSGWSQSYRPVIFKDIIPASTFEVSDKNLKDAKGYNFETGVRGKIRSLSWDISYFQLFYKNRLGTLAQKNDAGELVIFRTNIGNSMTRGLEFFTEYAFPLSRKTTFSIFTATAFMDAKYENAILRSGSFNTDVSGKKVESVPRWQSRNGLTIKTPQISFSALYSYTGATFADALNTVAPSISGASGLVPSYHLVDFNARVDFNPMFQLRLNLNNAFNSSYFTKRPQFYPGPGIWPSDPRSFSATLGFKL